MPILVDLLLVAIVVASAAWGYSQGLSATLLTVVGFTAGAIVSSRLAPLILADGVADDLAPVVALPAALVGGALVGMAAERLAFRLPPWPAALDAVGGVALAACVGVAAVWVVGATAAQVDALKGTTGESEVIGRLTAALPPPGPLLKPATKFENTTDLPLLDGPNANVGPANPNVRRDPQVRAAADRVLKVQTIACGHGGSGSGWIAVDGVVATNAHVVQGASQVTVQVGGSGPRHPAQPIWYDDVNDIAILRVPGVQGVRPLPLDLDSPPGTYAALLGFPGGGPYTVKPARVGATAEVPGRKVGEKFLRRPVTTVRAAARPGNSGGPVVDRSGRVVTMIFAGQRGGHSSYGVPLTLVAQALRRAGPPVKPGSC